jgi:hypothetical protein
MAKCRSDVANSTESPFNLSMIGRSPNNLMLVFFLVLFGSMTLTPAQTKGPASAETSAVLVDNTQAKFEGSWAVSSGAAGKFGADYQFAAVGEEITAVVTYCPRILKSGKYDVEIWYAHGSNRSPNAHWLISSADGETNVYLNQKIRGGEWNRIATAKQFETGTNHFVQLFNDSDAGPKVVVIADAVRFVPTTGGPLADNIVPAPEFTRVVSPQYGIPTIPTEVKDSGTIVLDNRNAELRGHWTRSKTTWPVVFGDDFVYAVVSATETATITYRPTIAKAGLFDVEAWHSEGDNRSERAHWTVVFDRGEVTTNIDQQLKGGEWVRLASGKPFASGTNGYARLSNKGSVGEEASVVTADAVRFVPTNH